MIYRMTKMGAKLPGEFQIVTSTHSTQCSLFCFRDAACNSFDYSKKHSVCLLNQKQLADVASGNVIDDPDYDHFEGEKRKVDFN